MFKRRFIDTDRLVVRRCGKSVTEITMRFEDLLRRLAHETEGFEVDRLLWRTFRDLEPTAFVEDLGTLPFASPFV